MAKVLVTDGRSRASLAIVRSLGEKGIKVVSGEAFSCSSFYSKYSERLSSGTGVPVKKGFFLCSA